MEEPIDLMSDEDLIHKYEKDYEEYIKHGRNLYLGLLVEHDPEKMRKRLEEKGDTEKLEWMNKKRSE